MVGELPQRIESVKSKAYVLTQRYTELLTAKREADAQINELKTLVAQQDEKIRLLSQQLEYMRVTTILSPDRNDLAHSRAILSQLVRDIDKCINELTQ